jgi:hypothetical protein
MSTKATGLVFAKMMEGPAMSVNGLGCTTVKLFLAVLVASAGLVMNVSAHCDTMDGPVISDAKLALEKGDATPVLKWVRAQDEQLIEDAFKKALLVRTKGPEARELAEQFFFETLVRVHRAGEGAPFTGIQPAGTPVEPGIETADKAVASGDPSEVAGVLTKEINSGIRERLRRTVEARKHKDDGVEAGREYVEAYVAFVHYVERLHQDAASDVGHHDGSSESGAEKGRRGEAPPSEHHH